MLFKCIGAINDGKGRKTRCRNQVPENGRLCHFKHDVMAPAPDIVLLKFGINPSWQQVFMSQGVRFIQNHCVPAKDAKHTAQAEALGRDPFRYRDVSDSGVPIFVEDGVKDGFNNASLDGLLEELAGTGRVVRQMHIIPRRDTPKSGMKTLVVQVQAETDPEPASEGAKQQLLRLIGVTWGSCRVWANDPRDSDGKVIHTVNFNHRSPDGKSVWKLGFTAHFTDGASNETYPGMWEVTQVQQ